jgi:hypothetical protein
VALIVAALLIGLAMTRSLAGILLGSGALVLAILIADGGRPGLARRHAVAAMAIVRPGGDEQRRAAPALTSPQVKEEICRPRLARGG